MLVSHRPAAVHLVHSNGFFFPSQFFFSNSFYFPIFTVLNEWDNHLDIYDRYMRKKRCDDAMQQKEMIIMRFEAHHATHNCRVYKIAI